MQAMSLLEGFFADIKQTGGGRETLNNRVRNRSMIMGWDRLSCARLQGKGLLQRRGENQGHGSREGEEKAPE